MRIIKHDHSPTIDQLLSQLPECRLCEVRSPAEGYGALHVAADFCGLKQHGLQLAAHWQHGWHPFHEQRTASFVIGDYMWDPADKVRPLFVARKDEEGFLREQGYFNSEAIGLPICYLKESGVDRVPRSLLVMPTHSLPSAAHDWDFEAYASAIDEIRDKFEAVVICLHPVCYSRGYWVSAFKRRGYQIISGMNWNDRNALTRLQMLMSGFEYVTTNGFGSHWAYAAYCGAKLSIYGPYSEPKCEHCCQLEHYRRFPADVEPACSMASEKANRAKFPFFFCEPQEASQHQAWGGEQLGAENRVSPTDLRRLLGWTALRVAKGKAKSFIKKVKGRLRTELGKQVKLALRPAEREVRNIVERAIDRPEYEAVEARIAGHSFLFKDRWSLDFLYREIWQKEIYKFLSNTMNPLVIDCGANVGMGILYFKHLYPMARVIAFEPDPVVFRILKENAKKLKWQEVELFQEAVWSSNEEATFQRHYNIAGRLLPALVSDGKGLVRVRTRRLRPLLEKQEVNFLKIDIEGAETEVLEDCADVLTKVRCMFFEYHSFIDKPQTLHRLLAIVNTAGFRVHVHAYEPNPHPLYLTQLRGDDFAEMNLDVFCYRV